MSTEIDEDHHEMMNGQRIQQSVMPCIIGLLDAVRFNDWWHHHGSEIWQSKNEDHEQHTKRVAAAAWIAAMKAERKEGA